jgi:hypothetical protein
MYDRKPESTGTSQINVQFTVPPSRLLRIAEDALQGHQNELLVVRSAAVCRLLNGRNAGAFAAANWKVPTYPAPLLEEA